MQRRINGRRVALTIAFLATIGLLATACSSGGTPSESSGSGSGSSALAAAKDLSIDVGLDAPIKIPAGQQLKVAGFSASGNSWQNAFQKSIKDTIEAAGGSYTQFDAKFDPQTQLDQLTNAVTTGGFNAWILTSFDGNLVCDTVAQAAAKGILVVTVPGPICGRDHNEWGKDYWQPGTLAAVDGTNSVTYVRSWMEAVNKRTEAGEKVLFVGGPQTNPATVSAQAAWDDVFGARSDLNLLPLSYTDFTAPTSLTKVQDVLAANPDITTILSFYTDITRGTLEAIDSAGLTGKVKVYDLGAEQFSIDSIKNGALTSTVPFSPIESGVGAAQAIIDAYNGKEVPHFIDPLALNNLGSIEDPLVIDSETVKNFTANY
jgi:ribose transport system substrate-binding protein